ncbi:MAG: PD-(D/E)XK nuclease family protein, partial [SAR324 cluster bacterium]|nr:PD-(D/E)XK nuclease family protein [SAR324 cluster bacterium]
MELSKRPPVFSLPSYSLTGDLIGFIRCGLQYRYTTIGQLPSSNPVQMWFGEFIHGVLEEAYRRYDWSRKQGTPDLPPWNESKLQEILDIIKRRLSAQKLFPYSQQLELIGDQRARISINELGPLLFPLIHRAEVRLKGARQLPVNQIPSQYFLREADRYEMVGVVDVVSHVE